MSESIMSLPDVSATDVPGACRTVLGDLVIESLPFGGSPLVRAALSGDPVATKWYPDVPQTAQAWAAALGEVRTTFEGRDWFEELRDALQPRGRAAERLQRVREGQGVVVTTGQQPGLFGGPIYTWSKAIAALALADELEDVLGVPVAPVFWAATDDADFAEASGTTVAVNDQTHTLRMPAVEQSGLPMANTPLGDVSALYDMLARSAGSGVNPEPLLVAKEAYSANATVGSAYVALLRAMFEPLGIAVLDAAHPAVREAGAPVVREALRRHDAIATALQERNAAIEENGFKVQVQNVPNLSLVFQSERNTENTPGVRTRVPRKDALSVADSAPANELGPNVLLRPIMERYILPTISYVAGPGEYAYFAQVSAVASALDFAAPRVIPRWSGRILEPNVRAILEKIGAEPDDFRDPHAVESRIAREEMPDGVRNALAGLRESVAKYGDVLRKQDQQHAALQRSVGSFQTQVSHRIDRLERRHAAAIKRDGGARLRDVAMARASLYPNGAPQERVLNIIPFLAKYGNVVQEAMLSAARAHAREIAGTRRGKTLRGEGDG